MKLKKGVVIMHINLDKRKNLKTILVMCSVITIFFAAMLLKAANTGGVYAPPDMAFPELSATTNNKIYHITEPGRYEVPNNIGNNKSIVVSAKNVELVFNNITMQGSTAFSSWNIGVANPMVNLNSPLVILPDAEVTMVLIGENSLICTGTGGGKYDAQSGIAVKSADSVGSHGKLTIVGSGSLKAYGGAFSAGIGGGPNQDSGTIIIKDSAKVEAVSGGGVTGVESNNFAVYAGAGIGGGGANSDRSGNNAGGIFIQENAEVIATSQGIGAGIGGGGTNRGDTPSAYVATEHASAGEIEISGNAKVEATSTFHGAGIGGGGKRHQPNPPYQDYPAGDGGNIKIYGGVFVKATSLQNGAGIGSGGSESRASGDGGIIEIYADGTGSPTIVANSGAGYDLGVGVSNNSSFPVTDYAYIKIVDGNVHAVNNASKPIVVKNGVENGDGRVYMKSLDFDGAYPKSLEYNPARTTPETGRYEYLAETDTAGKAYVWMPISESKFATTHTDASKTYDADDSKIEISGASRDWCKIESVEWVRINLNATSDIITNTDFNAKRNVADTDDKGNLYTTSNSLDDKTFDKDDFLADINARYCFKITYTDGTTEYKNVIVNNIYTPIEVWARDKAESAVYKNYTKLENADGTQQYGIPFDLNGDVLSSAAEGYDKVLYNRNADLPNPYWSITAPAYFIGAPYEITLNKKLANDTVDADDSENYVVNSETARFYTVQYNRTSTSWGTVEANFVDPLGRDVTINGVKSQTFLVPLDVDSLNVPMLSSTDFKINGGIYIPPSSPTHAAAGWYIADTPNENVNTSIDTNDQSIFMKLSNFVNFDPDFTFDSINPAVLNGKLYIVFDIATTVTECYKTVNGELIKPATSTSVTLPYEKEIPAISGHTVKGYSRTDYIGGGVYTPATSSTKVTFINENEIITFIYEKNPVPGGNGGNGGGNNNNGGGNTGSGNTGGNNNSGNNNGGGNSSGGSIGGGGGTVAQSGSSANSGNTSNNNTGGGGSTTITVPKDKDNTTTPKNDNVLETVDHIKYVNGYADNTVRPDAPITRAEVASIFWRLLKNSDKNKTINGTFKDVPNSEWYAKPINYLASVGILEGYNDGTFKPNENITRAEFATIVSRFVSVKSANQTHPFTDIDENHWGNPYVTSVYSKNWIGGYPDGTFLPDNNITRAETITVVNRMLERRIKKENISAKYDTLYVDLPRSYWAFADIIEASVEHDYEKSNDGYEVHIH